MMTEDYFRYDLTQRELDVLNTALAVARQHVMPSLARDMRNLRQKLLTCPTTQDPSAQSPLPTAPTDASPPWREGLDDSDDVGTFTLPAPTDTAADAADVAGNRSTKSKETPDGD